MAVRGFRGVRDDLSELSRHLLDIACFLSPLLSLPRHDSPPPSPRAAAPIPRPAARAPAGILSDLAEVGIGFRSGLSRLSSAFRDPADPDKGCSDSAGDSKTVGVSDEVLEFVGDLIKCPEYWLEFPVTLDDEFHISSIQIEHISTVEHFIPDLQSLRVSLCPTYMSEESFWRIYFALLHPKLSKHDCELLLTYQIVDSLRRLAKEPCNRPTKSENHDSESLPSLMSEKLGSFQQEDNESWQDALITKTRSQQSIDRWSEVTSVVDTSNDITKLGPDEISPRDTSQGNLFVMEKYMDSLLTEEQVCALHSFRRKHASAGEEDMATLKMPKPKMSSDDESSDWQAVEVSDFEILEKSSVDKSS
ncbi:hypothetical protein OPV22_005179 [Ensete ventricosum]|uniref:BSD domain-containing protein n=1 Tax=Ensete ventricosum TaxID=4639 RepID=A0AAV8RM55_ENSVE|nr:hypothetical protein OPV22_005179 [Ensete ventricosum]